MELEEQVLREVNEIRSKLPRVGTRKLQYMMRSEIGRDHLFRLLKKENKLIRNRRKNPITTKSRHGFKRYPNLIKGTEPKRPNEQYVSDITYIPTGEGYAYLSLITDRYSRAVVGHKLSRSLSVEGSLKALKKALRQRGDCGETIHHSDRGVQYSCHEYIRHACKHGLKTSMTEENHVYENAMAERVNGILKVEFGLNKRLKSFAAAEKQVQQSIELYNTYRPHTALGYKTPAEVHGNFTA